MVDRREALKKLGAAGVVVVGGSAVLSTRSVVYAASACVAVVPPPTVPLTFTQSTGSPRLIRVRWDNNRPTGAASQTYSWKASMASGTIGTVQVLNATSRQASLRRITPAPRPRDQKWVAGEACNVEVRVTWRCAVRNTPNVVAVYDSRFVARIGATWQGVGTLRV